MSFLICGIYEERPDVCKNYPERGSYQPEGCTYYFTEEGRKGDCDPYCQASCCMLPRADGVPGGAPLPEVAGGRPCKYLITVEQHPILSGRRDGEGRAIDGSVDTRLAGNQEEDREGLNPVERILADRGNIQTSR